MAGADEDRLIPAMSEGQLRGAVIPEGFLESYQTHFRFLTFETSSSVPCEGYSPRVKFKPFELEMCGDPAVDDNKIGGKPVSLLGNASPKSYARKTPMYFLLQLVPFFVELNLVRAGLTNAPSRYR
jgi:hypothetical protein